MEIFKVKLIYHLCLSFFLWIQMAPSGVIPFLQHSFIHFCVTVKYITILSICYRPNNTMLQIILCNCLLNQLKKKGKEMLNYTFHHYLHSQLYWKSLFCFVFFNEYCMTQKNCQSSFRCISVQCLDQEVQSCLLNSVSSRAAEWHLPIRQLRGFLPPQRCGLFI